MTLEQIRQKIVENPDSIDWESLSQYRALTPQFIEEYTDKVDWNCISQYQTLDPVLFIMPHKDDVNWNKIARYQKLGSDWMVSLPTDILALISFDTISETQVLLTNFINKFYKELNWDKISKYQNLAPVSLTYHYKRLNKQEISRYQDLSGSFIDYHKDDLYWPYICKYQVLSENFINDHLSYIDWNTLNIGKFTSQLSDAFVMSHVDDIGLRRILTDRELNLNTLENLVNTTPTVLDEYNNEITRYQSLTEAFIEEHNQIIIGNHNGKYLNWDNISYYQVLSENFMNNHKDEINWVHISAKQVCGQEFIRENRDKVNWHNIIVYQPSSVTESFLMEFMDKELGRESFGLISCYVQLSETTLMDNIDHIGWTNISRYQYLSEDFINQHADSLVRPKTICIDRDIRPVVPYGELTESYIEDLLIDYNANEEIDYNDFIEWHHDIQWMPALNSFWDAYDHYMITKESADRLNQDYTNDIKKYRNFDWLM